MKSITPYRIGIGFDAHLLKQGRRLILGGVNIPGDLGLTGHSDADVLIHSLIDALLGAMALPDIGTLFPDTDAKYKDADSTSLLKVVLRIIKRSGGRVLQTDSSIITDLPRLTPFIPIIRQNLASIFQIPPDRIGLKAKTTEGTRIALARRSIAVISTALIYRGPR